MKVVIFNLFGQELAYTSIVKRKFKKSINLGSFLHILIYINLQEWDKNITRI